MNHSKSNFPDFCYTAPRSCWPWGFLVCVNHRWVNACKISGIVEIEVEFKEYSDLLVIEANRYREKTWQEKLKEAEALERILREKAKKSLRLSEGRG